LLAYAHCQRVKPRATPTRQDNASHFASILCL
jgi:hypothetical protein